MAAGDNVKFPVPIMFNDNQPSGFATLILTIREMKVKKSLIGKDKAINADITCDINPTVLLVHVVVTVEGQTDPVVYEYKKNLPYDVDTDRCSWEVRGTDGDSLIVVKLAKAKDESWTSQSTYMMQRPTTP